MKLIHLSSDAVYPGRREIIKKMIDYYPIIIMVGQNYYLKWVSRP